MILAMSKQEMKLNCVTCFQFLGPVEAKIHGCHFILQRTSQPPQGPTNPLTDWFVGNNPLLFTMLSAAMTRFTILSLYLHAITPAPCHVRAVWSPVRADPRVGAVSTEPSLLCLGLNHGHVILNVSAETNHTTKLLLLKKEEILFSWKKLNFTFCFCHLGDL